MDSHNLDSDTDLPTLVAANDHWNVLKYIRIHKLRESALVLHHGGKLLFTTSGGGSAATGSAGTSSTTKLQFSHKYQTTIGYYTILEQVCLAALDVHQFLTAECCLAELEKELQLNHKEQGNAGTSSTATSTATSTVTAVLLSSTSVRYQLLRARYYEAIGETATAQQIYTTVLRHNPSNRIAATRQYAILKSQPQQELQSIESLNDTIATHASYNDSSIFYELYSQYKNIGQYVYSIYCLQQVLYIMSAIRNADTIHMSFLHCELAECYITRCCSCGTDSDDATTPATTSAANTTHRRLDQIRTARKHMAMALELNPSSLRAQFGLVVIANRYLLHAAEPQPEQRTGNSSSGSNSKTTSKKAMMNDDRLLTVTHEIALSNALIRHGAEQIVETTSDKHVSCSKHMQAAIQALIEEYTEGL